MIHPLSIRYREYANVAGRFQRSQMYLLLGAQIPPNKLSLAEEEGSSSSPLNTKPLQKR